MNFGKGASVPTGKDATPGGFWMGTPSHGRSYGLPIDSRGNIVGSSNWQEFLGDAVYPQPLEVQNHNTAFHNFSGIGQVGVPGVASDSSGNRNQGLNQINEMYNQPLCADDGSWSGSWEQLLTLMKAPSAVPRNVMANNSMRAINGHALIPNSNSHQNCSTIPPPLAKVPYAVRESGAASNSMNLAAACVMPSSYSQGINLMQYMMMKAQLKANSNRIENRSCLNANGYVTPIANSHESSNQMQPNVAASSALLNQSYYIAPMHSHRNNSSSSILQDGFPVSQQPQYNLNSTDVDAGSSITSCSHFAPLTPQPAKINRQYPATSLSLVQNLNQSNVLEDNFAASSTQFTPATPQALRMANNYQSPATQNLSVHQIQSQDKVQQESLAGCIENGSIEHDCQEIIHRILDSSSAAIGTSIMERNDSDNENQNIDMSKTPPKKASKRKKHRPKVIVENKPPRRRAPATAKIGPDGTPVPKRKYVRKNKCNAIEIPKTDVGESTPVPKRKYVRKNKCNAIETPQTDVREKTDSESKATSKSCRRSLNFDLQDNIIDTAKLVDQQKRWYQTEENIFHNVNTQEPKQHVGCNPGIGINSSPQSSQKDLLIQGNKEAGNTASPSSSICQKQKENSLQLNQYIHWNQPIMRGLQIENSYMSTRNEAKRATDLCKTTANNLRGQMLQIMAPNQQQRVSEYIQSRGYKRDFGFIKQHEGFGHLTDKTSSQFLCKELFPNEHNGTNSRVDQCYLGNHKRKKIESSGRTNSSTIQDSASFVGKHSSQIQTNEDTVNHFSEVNSGLLKSHESNPCRKPYSDFCYLSSELHVDSASPHAYPLRQPISSEVSLSQEMLAQKPDKKSALAHVINSLNAWTYPMTNQIPSNRAFSGTERLVTEAIDGGNQAIMSAKKRNKVPILPEPMANNLGLHMKQKNMISMEDIMYQLDSLNLNSTSEMVKNEQRALVLYKGDGTIIPYEGFDPLKRRKPRPKVDLDPETNRLWNFLMGKQVSDDDKQTNEQKTTYWEGERKVFRGRADSFIARMHLVQGDRRFSPWKGSVVDSVIGVFLTQNVTDHLSSSAFMSLAARFPPRSIRRDVASSSNKPDALVEGPEICTIEMNHKVQSDQKFTNLAIYSRNPSEPLDQQKQKPASVACIQQSVKANNGRSDEVISSQDSSESANGHTNGAVPSLFESDSKADCPTNGCQPISRYSTCSFIDEMEKLIRVPNFTSQESGNSYHETAINGHLQLQNVEASKQKELDGVNINDSTTATYPFDLNRPQLQIQNISSINSIAGGLGSYETDCCNMLRNQQHMSLYSSAASEDMGITGIGIQQQFQGDIASVHNRTWPTEPPTENPYTSHRKNTDQENSTQVASHNYYYRTSYCNHQQEKNISTQFGSKSDKEPLHGQSKLMESDVTADGLPAHSSSAAENGAYIQNKAVESNLKEQDCSSSGASSRTKKNISKEKGRNAEGEKKPTVDWDSLRREVLSSGSLRERSQDTMDSIDYEALQHAGINAISDAIKERGMNNLLADRIKDFLNRLVRDHGSIDLEWLRDAPPDKAKDYLLSIRGLGLKSVECIRLLTLHQHAFPVDTNVGRIAVRLGWVPLQPLPESLQLHLLELYPVLESIQKYLWPRLCNLDQRTLYELHYQLITFGKVFCTKSRPNCNACPMRGECRHFASAFASSRLALPGPEDKSIVTSNIPIETSRNPTIDVSPIPLHSLPHVPPEEATSAHRTCEPIVEEPTTPEPESTEISLADIEDAFYEDPDEIPTIRLNVEEFTQNLQNFMQENMELQEADMSKALVALNPKAASIPTPKLKNVSRLRTEHQVYELPDSHPLLKELDKREPDDPSPYLLAIWTPGETANSIQPTEGLCGFQESGKLCSEKTCFTCNSIRESNSQTVRGTLLIPCRTAMGGSFPLNGTYFQVNEVFADHESSLNPIDVPRAWIWNLPRRTVYFGTSVTTIFKGMSTEEIQYSFWKGSVCVRGFDQKTRAPKPLMARLHFPASRQVRAQKRSKKSKNT